MAHRYAFRWAGRAAPPFSAEPMPDFDTQQWDLLSGTLALQRVCANTHIDVLDTRCLLDVQQCQAVLDALGPAIGASSRAITASLLGKRIAFLVVSASLYAMSVLNRGLDMRLANCVTDYTHHTGAWRSKMLLKDLTVTRPDPADRGAWRDTVVQGIFAGHLAPLWVALHHASGIAPRILWENTAVRVYSLYEKRIARLADATVRAQAADDFRYLTGAADSALFATEHNPLAQYFFAPRSVQRGDAPALRVRVRKTCCLYYMATTPAQYCSTCPLLYPSPRKDASVASLLEQR